MDARTNESKNSDFILKSGASIDISIDKKARAVYFKVSDDKVLRTVRPNESVSVDFGKDNQIVGIELIRIGLQKA